MRYMPCDIETYAIDDAATYVEPVSAPSNYKDPLKIAEYEQRALAEQLEKAALDPDLARIVAIGYAGDSDEPPVVLLCRDERDERDALRSFWATWYGRSKPDFVTYNGSAFDLPVLVRRSLYLSIAAPDLVLDKYKHPRVIDLQKRLSHNGQFRWRSLSFYCNRFGITGGDDDKTGADIARLVQEGHWSAIENHCRADVLRTKALALRVGAIPAREEQVA